MKDLQGLKTRAACTTGITMQMDRRQILQGAAAAVLGAPVASYATIGDFPKQAFFGSAPISAPFGDTYGQAGAPIWEKLQDTERGIYERILTNTKTHLDNVEGFISKPSWDEATSELRLEMGETRKAMVRLSDVAESPVTNDYSKHQQAVLTRSFELCDHNAPPHPLFLTPHQRFCFLCSVSCVSNT